MTPRLPDNPHSPPAKRPPSGPQHDSGASDGPIPFPGAKPVAFRSISEQRTFRNRRIDAPRDPAGEVLAAFADVSRRINHLARELKCFGFFDDEDDRPRAA